MHAEPAGVHDALGDPFVIEVEDLLPEVEVLERRWAALADAQRVLIVGDGSALLRRQPGPARAGHLVRLAAGAGLIDQIGGG